MRGSQSWRWSFYVLFPVLQAALFAGSIFARSPGVMVLAVALAAYFHSFSIHVSAHEWLHQGRGRNAVLDFLASIMGTLLLGIPLEGYVYHHRNHHRHNNGPQDFSTTWTWTSSGMKAQNPWIYALTWYRQTLRARRSLQGPETSDRSRARIRFEKYLLLALMALMILVSTKTWILYFTMIYGGWFFTALHNFGQHPPIPSQRVQSYTCRTVNRWLMNNGLHWEHHDEPTTPTWKLRVRIPYPALAGYSFMWVALSWPFWREGGTDDLSIEAQSEI